MGRGGEWKMVRYGWKSRWSQSSCDARIEGLDMSDQETEIGTKSYELLHFSILELPMHVIYDILSRLPLKSIFTCRLVCKLFLKILKDPYFAQVHLGATPITVNLVLQKCTWHHFCMSLFMLDCDHVLKVSSSSSSIDGCQGSVPRRRQYGNGCVRTGPYHTRTSMNRNAEKCFLRGSRPTIVGDCHGLLCTLYAFPNEPPIYCIRNPMNGVDDYVAFHYLPPSDPPYSYLDVSGFAYCPKTKVYKVIRFAAMPSHDPMASVPRGETVVEMYTLGSDSWRRIYGVPSPKLRGSFDPYLNGFFHWLTVSNKPSQLICSLDLEKECFRYIPPPEHLSIDYYTNKISWINVGTLRGCLCLCYVLEHAYFEVWLMEKYGVMESWRREFSIDLKFYTGLKEEDLQRPLKFLDNGDLWLHCRTDLLVSYSPRNRTFRIFETLGQLRTDVTMQFPSFLSPKLAVGGDLEDCALTFYLPPMGQVV